MGWKQGYSPTGHPGPSPLMRLQLSQPTSGPALSSEGSEEQSGKKQEEKSTSMVVGATWLFSIEISPPAASQNGGGSKNGVLQVRASLYNPMLCMPILHGFYLLFYGREPRGGAHSRGGSHTKARLQGWEDHGASKRPPATPRVVPGVSFQDPRCYSH